MKLLVLAAVVLLAVAACMPGRRGSRMVEQPLDDLAVLRVPARLRPQASRLSDVGLSMRLSSYMTFGMPGSSTPTHEDLVIAQAEPRRAAQLGSDVTRRFANGIEHTQDITWETPTSNGDITLQVGSGRYTPNTMDRPAWVVHAFDRERSVAVLYRVLQNRASRAQAVALVDSVLASYRLVSDVAGFFAGVERDLGGAHIAFPVELTDPFSWQRDESGVAWMFFRRHRSWADDQDLPEQTVAAAAFFQPNDAQQEQVAREVARRGVLEQLDVLDAPGRAADGVTVERARHRAGARTEDSWLVTGVDAGRGVAVAYRVWHRDASEAAAVATVKRALASAAVTNPNLVTPRPRS